MLTFTENLSKVLHEEKEEIEIKGNIFIWDENESELKLDIVHHGKNTKSKIIIHAVIEGNAKLKITGQVKIEKDANLSDAYLEVKILKLSNKARVVVIPEMNIDNKNVNAKHAVIIKKISKDDMFFLQSRGIGIEKAHNMIIDGFLELMEKNGVQKRQNM